MAISAFFSNKTFFNLGLLLLIAVSSPHVEHSAENVESRPFQILNGSQLYLKGNSNVTPFTCYCQQAFPQQFYTMTPRPQSNLAVFHNTRLLLETKKLDCGNRGMNRDMHQTLKADAHPHIAILLQEVRYSPGASGASGALTAKAILTVTGKSRTVQMQVKAEESTDKIYRFVSSLSIKMTDFGITPPTAMLGLIKVDDTIDIHFDLLVRAGDVPRLSSL